MTFLVQRFMAFKANELQVMTTTTTQFEIMCPYCAHVCILGCKTMLTLGFPSSSHRKSIYHFRRAEKCFFREAATKNVLQNWANPFFINIRQHFIQNSPAYFIPKAFRAPLAKQTNSCRFSRKRVKFELQLHHSLLMIFSKNHFQSQKMLFRGRSTKSYAGFNPQLCVFLPAIQTTT